MIYIINEQENEIRTDIWINYIPSNFTVYLDDILIGTFLNESISTEYIIFTIPALSLIDLQNKEYTISYYSDSVLIKQELVVVTDNKDLEIKVINKSNEIIMYE